MSKTKLTLAATLLAALPLLQGCIPALVGGAAASVISYQDRRSTGTQTDDEGLEWKSLQRIPEQYRTLAHVNFTAYNRRLLITGEVPGDEAKAAIESQVRQLEGVREVFNEAGVGPASSLGSRSNDSYITSKVKARLVDSNQISANHIKVVTERAIVYLMGVVSEREAKVAIAVARTTAGVSKVVNVLEVLGDDEIRRLDSQSFGSRTPPPASAPVENR